MLNVLAVEVPSSSAEESDDSSLASELDVSPILYEPEANEPSLSVMINQAVVGMVVSDDDTIDDLRLYCDIDPEKSSIRH